MTTYMVAVDESKFASNAFETVLLQVKPEDTIYLITVVIRPLLGSKHFRLSKTAEENYNQIVSEQKKEARKLLLSYRFRLQKFWSKELCFNFKSWLTCRTVHRSCC
eukprot:TRINITY_DN1773_c0_g1_i1.p1 TRINITY_DN1773_c0_g1~~TRINITY_DN1773_c0_g1_i1.p1  ORF type:complete len:119 (-),score=23.74 TRINITY_DN1773_c0_g1_i1:717-1034(-)